MKKNHVTTVKAREYVLRKLDAMGKTEADLLFKLEELTVLRHSTLCLNTGGDAICVMIAGLPAIVRNDDLLTVAEGISNYQSYPHLMDFHVQKYNEMNSVKGWRKV